MNKTFHYDKYDGSNSWKLYGNRCLFTSAVAQPESVPASGVWYIWMKHVIAAVLALFLTKCINQDMCNEQLNGRVWRLFMVEVLFFFFLIFCHICEHGVFTVKKWWPHSPTYSLNYLKKQTKYSIFLCMMHVHLQQNLKNKTNVCLDDRFCCRCFTIHTPSPLSVLVPNNLLQNCQQIVEVVMIKAKLLNYLVPVLSFFILILVLLLGCVQLM